MSIYLWLLLIVIFGDGLETITRILLYKRNRKIWTQMRAEISLLPPKKYSYGFIIPSYRNAQETAKTVNNLVNDLGYLLKDIVVIDDFSNDDNKNFEEIKKLGTYCFQVAKEEKDIRKVRAQQKGVEFWMKKKKDFVICLDSDCVIASTREQIERAMMEMEMLGIDAMGGRIVAIIDEQSNLLERFQFSEYNQSMKAFRGSLYHVLQHHQEKVLTVEEWQKKYSIKYAVQTCISGAFGIFRPEKLLGALIKMKHVWGGEDVEITQRLLASHLHLGYNDDIVVKTIVPQTRKRWSYQRKLRTIFMSSYLLHDGYFWNFFKKPKKDGSGLRWKRKWDATTIAFSTQLTRDILRHPVKLFSLLFFIFQPYYLLIFLFMYRCLSVFNSFLILQKEEKFSFKTDFLLPFYRIWHMYVPMTVGYFTGMMASRAYFHAPQRIKKTYDRYNYRALDLSINMYGLSVVIFFVLFVFVMK